MITGFAFAWARTQCHQHPAGVDGDAHLQRHFWLRRPVADGEGSAHRTLGIVFMGDRRAEQRHHGVADELLDGTAEAFEIGSEPLVIWGEQGANVLGIETLGRRGEAHQVGEEHRNRFAFLASLDLGFPQRRPAERAEPSAN